MGLVPQLLARCRLRTLCTTATATLTPELRPTVDSLLLSLRCVAHRSRSSSTTALAFVSVCCSPELRTTFGRSLRDSSIVCRRLRFELRTTFGRSRFATPSLRASLPLRTPAVRRLLLFAASGLRQWSRCGRLLLLPHALMDSQVQADETRPSCTQGPHVLAHTWTNDTPARQPTVAPWR